MRRTCLFACALGLAPPALADGGADVAWTTRYIGELHAGRGDSPFALGLPLTSFGRDSQRLEQEARGKLGPVSLLLTGTLSGQEGAEPKSHLLANEAYADFGSGADRFSIGKKILSAGVGYGFRPLDVLQRERRLRMLPPQLDGVPQLSWQRFTADDAWSVILANPGHGERGDPKTDGSLALRWYGRRDGVDLHGVARASQRFGLEAGGGFSAVPSPALELHGEFLAASRGERMAPQDGALAGPALLAPTGNLQTEVVHAPVKALGGFTWTTETGWSFVGEAWWDGTAPSAADWQRLAAQAAARNALAGLPGVPAAAVAGSQAAATRMFQDPGFGRRAALAHLAWSDPAGGNWSGYADLLATLEDRGWTATAALAWQGDRTRMDVGVRRYGGAPASAYRLLPERGIAFIGVSLSY